MGYLFVQWSIKKRKCFMKNHLMIVVRFDFWARYSRSSSSVTRRSVSSKQQDHGDESQAVYETPDEAPLNKSLQLPRISTGLGRETFCTHFRAACRQ
ncbi:hypothetical protein ACLOJK_033261 [Asimina triloba]